MVRGCLEGAVHESSLPSKKRPLGVEGKDNERLLDDDLLIQVPGMNHPMS